MGLVLVFSLFGLVWLPRMLSCVHAQVLEFNHIDCPLAIGYMLAMPTRRAYDTFRRTIRYSSDDYGRCGKTPDGNEHDG